ncbi:MAG: DinB family protein [Acidobacteria bacterium]|nr:DinB family protein [Acidobacteriota bacterium]
MEREPEAWLRGPVPGVSPYLAPVLSSFQQAREDLARHTEGLGPDQIWAQPHGLTSAGFHMRHIGGSVTRLAAYLEGRQLTAGELAAIEKEAEPGPGRDELLAGMDEAFARAERIIRALPAADLTKPVEVGRKRLRTTVIGLVTHIAEHTQRHVGQAISAARLARAAS